MSHQRAVCTRPWHDNHAPFACCLSPLGPYSANSTAGHLTNLDSRVEWRCPTPSQHKRHRFHISYSHVAIYLLVL